MARGVKAGTAYIDIKLGSFDQFKAAAEARAKEVGANVARKMSDQIGKHPAIRKAGQQMAQTVGDEAAKAAPGRLARFKSAIGRTLGESGVTAGKNFVTQMGLGFKSLGLADGQFAAASFSAAGRSLGTFMSEGFKGVVPKIGSTLSSLGSAVGNFSKNLGSSIVSGLSKLPGAMSKASQSIGAFSQKVGLSSYLVGNLGTQLTYLATVPVVGVATAMSIFGIKAGIALENATVGLAPFVGGMKNAQKEVEILSKIAAESPAFNTGDVISYARKLQAAHLPQQKTIDLMKALSNVFTTLGVTQEGASNSLLAITQVMQKGKVSSEELTRQLGQQIPAWDLLSEATGKTVKQLQDEAASGKFTSDDFVNALIKIGNSKKFLDGAATGALTLQSRFENLKENIQNKLAVVFTKVLFPVLEDLIGKYGPSLKKFIDQNGEAFATKLGNGIKKAVDVIKSLVDAYRSLTPAQQDFVKKFLTILVAAGPVVLILSKVVGGLAALGSTLSILLSPLGLLAAVLGVAVAGGALLGKDAIGKFIDAAGGLPELFRKIQAKAKPVIDWFKSDVTPIFQTLKGFVNEAITGFAKIPNPASKVDRSSKGNAGKDTDTIPPPPTETEKAFQKFRDIIDGAASAINDNLIPALKNLKGEFGSTGKTVDGANSGLRTLKDILVGVIAVFAAIAVVQITIVVAAFAIVVGAIKAVIDVFEGLDEIGHSVVAFYKDLFTGNFGKLGEDLKGIWNGIWKATVTAFLDFVNTIIGIVGGWVNTVIDFFKHLWDVLVGHSIVPDMINAIVSWFVGLPGRVLGALVSFVMSVINKFTDLKTQATKNVSDLISTVVSTNASQPSKAAGAVCNLSGILVGKGEQLVQGLISGMSNMLQRVKEKAAEIAGAASQSVAHRLDVHSPSRVGRHLGQMFGLGLVLGQDDMLDDISRSGRGLADAAINAVQPQIAGFNPDGLNGGTAQGDVNVTVNVPAPVTNPAEIATYTARSLSTALANKTI